MKNVKLNAGRISKLVIKSGEFTEESVKNCVEEFEKYPGLILADGESEAENIFKEMFADSDSGAEEYMNHFGGVHSNQIESFILNVTDPTDDYTHQFKVSIYEYYVDSGSVDYIYGISVSSI